MEGDLHNLADVYVMTLRTRMHSIVIKEQNVRKVHMIWKNKAARMAAAVATDAVVSVCLPCIYLSLLMAVPPSCGALPVLSTEHCPFQHSPAFFVIIRTPARFLPWPQYNSRRILLISAPILTVSLVPTSREEAHRHSSAFCIRLLVKYQ